MLIEDGFDLLPTLPGTAGTAVILNGGGTGFTTTTGALALAGNFTTTGAFNTTLIQQASVSLTLPAVSGTLATLAGTETLTNKTLTTPTITSPVVTGGTFTSPTLVTPALGTPASGVLTNCTGTATGLTAGSATVLATARAIYGNNFDGSAALTQVIASTYGGTGNGFTKFSGPATTEKTFTLPDASTTIVTTGATSTITIGYSVTPYNAGTKSSGTYTPAPADGNFQYATNNGAHTLAAPASDCSISILYTNGASAGSITFSGFTVGTTGDALTTTNTDRFIISIIRINSVATYLIKSLQA